MSYRKSQCKKKLEECSSEKKSVPVLKKCPFEKVLNPLTNFLDISIRSKDMRNFCFPVFLTVHAILKV